MTTIELPICTVCSVGRHELCSYCEYRSRMNLPCVCRKNSEDDAPQSPADIRYATCRHCGGLCKRGEHKTGCYAYGETATIDERSPVLSARLKNEQRIRERLREWLETKVGACNQLTSFDNIQMYTFGQVLEELTKLEAGHVEAIAETAPYLPPGYSISGSKPMYLHGRGRMLADIVCADDLAALEALCWRYRHPEQVE